MKRSQMIDNGYDYDYDMTIRQGDAYMHYDEWQYEEEEDWEDWDVLEQGFDPYEGGYTFDC